MKHAVLLVPLALIVATVSAVLAQDAPPKQFKQGSEHGYAKTPRKDAFDFDANRPGIRPMRLNVRRDLLPLDPAKPSTAYDIKHVVWVNPNQIERLERDPNASANTGGWVRVTMVQPFVVGGTLTTHADGTTTVDPYKKDRTFFVAGELSTLAAEWAACLGGKAMILDHEEK